MKQNMIDMRVYVISHKLFNQKTGRLTLTGEQEMKRIANLVNGKIPDDDNIKIITEVDDGSAKQYQIKSAEIFSKVLFFEHETSPDPIEEFKKKTVYGYKQEGIQAVILITNKNISKLNWFFTKERTERKEEKIKFPEGKLICLEITNGYVPLVKMNPS